ncbi:hypothetical protein C8Q80DRAFT_1347004 [Daedaleopsis nitida]|nr:hypothetical protein C8Q80DRAFT_1347004 [Daedaleopsis nitida]
MLDCARRLQMDGLFYSLRDRVLDSIKSSRPLATYFLAYHHDLADIAKDALELLQTEASDLGYLRNNSYDLGRRRHPPRRELLPRFHIIACSLTERKRKSPAMVSCTTRSVEEEAADKDEEMQSDIPPESPSAEEDSWLQAMLKRTTELLRSPNETREINPDARCGSFEEHVRLILKIERLHIDVLKAIYEKNTQKLSLCHELNRCDVTDVPPFPVPNVELPSDNVELEIVVIGIEPRIP